VPLKINSVASFVIYNVNVSTYEFFRKNGRTPLDY
jgi:hypothetical protein